MKNLFIYTAILCSIICATAQNVEKNDTILSIKNTKNIVITENKNGLKGFETQLMVTKGEMWQGARGRMDKLGGW